MNRLDRIITRRRLQGKVIGFIREKEAQKQLEDMINKNK